MSTLKLTISLLLLLSSFLFPFLYLGLYTLYNKVVEHISYKRGNSFSTLLSEAEIFCLTNGKSKIVTFDLPEEDFNKIMTIEFSKRQTVIKVFFRISVALMITCFCLSVFFLGSYYLDGVNNLNTQLEIVQDVK